MKTKGTLLIVIYNKSILESTTLSSLIQYPKSLHNIDLLIWNNGPNEVDSSLPKKYQDKFASVTIHQTLHNVSLSKIYNQALKHKNNTFCIILDDDSTLTENYLDVAVNADDGLCLVPILTNNGEIQSPTVNKEKISTTGNPESLKKFRAAGSGVIIGQHFADKVKQVYGSTFDERFLLYGVDMTFFMRVEAANLLSRVRVVPGFEHSYSRLENKKNSLSEFRIKERSYDEGLRVRYYKSKPSLLLYTFKLIKKIALKKENKIEKYILDAILTGQHYRNTAKENIYDSNKKN